MSIHVRVASVLARRAHFRLFRFFRRTLDAAMPTSVPAGLELRVLRESDLAPWSSKPELELNPEKVAAAFAQGDICAGAFDADRLVGYSWFAFAPVFLLDAVWVDFHRKAVWIYKSFVLPSHRGRGIAPALYRLTDPASVERGRQFSICCIESHNRPSIAAIRRSGYHDAGFGGYRWTPRAVRQFMSPAAGALAVRFFIPQAS